jgi:hypothetical protein
MLQVLLLSLWTRWEVLILSPFVLALSDLSGAAVTVDVAVLADDCSC